MPLNFYMTDNKNYSADEIGNNKSKKNQDQILVFGERIFFFAYTGKNDLTFKIIRHLLGPESQTMSLMRDY